MRKSGWLLLPAAFFLYLNYSQSPVKIHFFQRLVFFLFLVFLFIVLRRFKLGKIIRTVTGGVGAIIFLYGIVQKFVLFPFHLSRLSPGSDHYADAFFKRIASGRIYSIFALPTLYSIICVVLVILIFHYLLNTPRGKKAVKLWWGVLLALGLVNLVLTQSFGGVICLFAAGLIYLLVSGILKFKFLAPVLMVLALFLSVTIALRFSEASKLEPVKLRYSNWVQAARVTASSPFWGVGLGNYENRISYHTLGHEAKSIYAHNFFLQFIAEAGLVFSAFFLLLLWNTRKKWKLSLEYCKSHIEYVTVLAALLVYNLIDIGIYFFSSGVIAVIALSQLYPCGFKTGAAGGKEPVTRRWVVLTGLMVCLLLLSVDYIADNNRIEGDILQSRREFGEAAERYRSSLDLNPYNYKALIGYATMQLLKSQPGEAQLYLERALDLYPDIAPGHFLMSRIHYKNQRLFSALHHAAAAAKKNPLSGRYGKWLEYLVANLQKAVNQTWKRETNTRERETKKP